MIKVYFKLDIVKIFNILWLFTICKFVCLPTNGVFPECLLILSNLFCYSHPHELNLILIIYSKWFWHVLTPVTCSSVNTFSTCLPGKENPKYFNKRVWILARLPDISDKLIETICIFLCQILDFYISKSLFGPEEI